MSANSPKSITELARRELEEELDRYETPQECLEYLLDDSHFKSISKELVEILQNVCGLTDRSIDEMIQFVAERILELENPEGFTKEALRNKKKVVARWFNKNVIPDRESAIKICFALKLDYEKTKEFLKKGCKSYAFNVRNAEDAVYMYCLMKGRTYAKAQELLDKYYDAEAPEIIPAVAAAPSSSSTTQILLQEIKNGGMDESALENDDSFLKNVLVRNKNRFIGYAKTAVKIYYDQKQCLQERLIHNSINEAVDAVNYVIATNADTDPKIFQVEEYNTAIYRLLNTLRAFSVDHDEFSPLLSLLETDNSTASQVWDDIMELFDQDAFKDPCDKGAFLDKMMPIDAMLREVMHDLPYDRWKADRDFASYTRSSLSDLVQGLTIKRGYEAFEKAIKKVSDPKKGSKKDPKKTPEKELEDITFSTSTRKIIMLMFYLNYIDGWTPDTDYDEKNYGLFFNELTEILDECQFASLYHADPFDWLMLRSVIGIENHEPWADMQPDDEVDPSGYFFEVLRLSFDSSIPERYLSRYEALTRTYEYLCFEDARKFSYGQISYGDRVQHSQSPNASFTYKVDANIDRNLSAKIAEAAEQLQESCKETVAVIHTVADEEERNILIKRYIEFKDFDIISDEMKISPKDIYNKYLMALEHVIIPPEALTEFED